MAKLNLMRNLVIDAIRAYYHQQPEKMYEEIKSITNYYPCHNRIIAKAHQKIHHLEMNNIIIRSVLSNQSPIKRDFITGKYKDNKSMVTLSMTLYASVSQLSIWHNEILGDIQGMMFYRIQENDIFSRQKIMNMIHILDQQIEFLSDLHQEFVDGHIIYFLKHRKERYTNLYTELMNIISDPSETKGKVIRQRTEHYTDETLLKIAEQCNLSIATVSSYITEFKHDIFGNKDYTDLIEK